MTGAVFFHCGATFVLFLYFDLSVERSKRFVFYCFKILYFANCIVLVKNR